MHKQTKVSFWPQAPEAIASQGGLRKGEARDLAACSLHHFEAVWFLTLRTPKAKNSRLERTETQGGRPEQSLYRQVVRKKTWGQSHFCVCFIGSKTAQGRRHGEFCPVSLPLGQHGERGMLKELEPMEMPLPPRSQDAP